MSKQNFPFNHFGESLDTTPDFLLMKRMYEEDLLQWEEKNNCEKLLEISEHIPNFDTPLKENLPLNQPTYNEENILRNDVEPVRETGDSTTMV